MKPSGIQYKGGLLCIFLGMAIASFSLFLHPQDPNEFLQLAIFNPQETFQFFYGFVQAIGFWVGSGLMGIGFSAILNYMFQAIRHILFSLQLKRKQVMSIDNEDNWIFL